jgi:hypothetical protein
VQSIFVAAGDGGVAVAVAVAAAVARRDRNQCSAVQTDMDSRQDNNFSLLFSLSSPSTAQGKATGTSLAHGRQPIAEVVALAPSQDRM